LAEEQPLKPGASTSPSAKAVPASTDPNVFSLEDLDKIIESEDPDFKKELEKLKNQKLELSADHENLSVKTDDEHLTKDEHENPSRREALLKWILNPYRRLGTFLRMQSTAIYNRIQHFFSRTISFIRHELPDRIKYYKSQSIVYAQKAKAVFVLLKKMPRSQKIAISFISVASVAAVFFMSKTLTGHWLPHYEDNMSRSLLSSSGFARTYQGKGDLQDLFLAFPEVEYYVLLKKAVVNLRPSESSGPNPMGAFEVYVGVDTQDTAIEVKDRERELVDVFQRALEGFSYDDSITMVGKSRMKEVIRDRINAILNQGRVFHIYFNSFIVYSGS
jgi:flagellar basal body-associated protein FliL